jgi:hypothetical protein
MFALTSLVLAATWSFSIDGTLANADFTPLPGGGAVVKVGLVPLLLDEPRRYDFTTERDEATRVTRVFERGQLVGVSLEGIKSSSSGLDDALNDGPDSTVEQALQGVGGGAVPTPEPTAAVSFSREQLAGLRGFAFTAGAVVPQAMVDQLVPAHACLGAAEPYALGGELGMHGSPSLRAPAGFACVVLERVWAVDDLAAARFVRDDDGAFDAEALARAQKLEVLMLKGSKVPWPALGKLPALRELSTRWHQAPFEPVTFPALEVLRIDEGMTADFQALAAPKLTTLVLNSRQVTQLPAKLPLLARGAINTPLMGEPSLKAFFTAHPDAKLEVGWLGLLKFEVAGLDGVSVHTGLRSNKLLAEARLPEAAAQLLSTLAFDELSAGYCSCDGGPTLQLLKGDLVLAQLSVQHGQALRWRWPGDAALKSDGLPKLLAAWGVGEPLEEWVHGTRRREGEALRRARYAQLLPRSVAPYAMGSSVFDPDLETELKKLEGTGLERFAFYLRLEGTAVEGLEASPADRLGNQVLSRATPVQLATLASRQDPLLDAGLRQRLFGYNVPELVGSTALAPHLPRLTLQALGSASAGVHEWVLSQLAKARGPGVTAALRAVVAEETVPVEARQAAALEWLKRKDAAAYAPSRALCEGKTSTTCVEVLRRAAGR